MRYSFTLLVLLSICSLSSYSQQVKSSITPYSIRLQSGSFIPESNISEKKLEAFQKKLPTTAGKNVFLIQFEELPAAAERNLLASGGVELLTYVSGNAYTATAKKSLDVTLLKKAKTRAVTSLSPIQKMHTSLAKKMFPRWAVKIGGTIDLWFSYPVNFTPTEIKAVLAEKNIDLLDETYQQYHILSVRIAQSRIEELAAQPFVEYIQPTPKEDEEVNNKSTVQTKANLLKSWLPGERALSGRGVVIGVGDNANPLRHIDFSGRIINRNAIAAGTHGVHVMGIVGGAGIRDERFEGFAPKSTMLSQVFSNVLAYAPAYVQDYGMVITNNSYGNIVDDCSTFGVYDLYSRIMDLQMLQLPNLQHVFAAGNSGTYTCLPYLPGYSNVLGAYQSAKNVITVGNADEINQIAAGSSKGPVRDGRIKPEITAMGTWVRSSYPTNTYLTSSGTSMAAPAISGGLALLYERYRQLHGGTNPQNGLMKAILCNGATDEGMPGPDFQYGFGIMNLLRSVKMLEQANYFQSTVAPAATQTHTLTLPAGIAQLKVMLYWNDSAAVPFAARTLINDLDLTVTSPEGTVHFPQLLDTTATHVSAAATTGEDHINNIEQVVINTPAAGNYTFTVKGTSLPSGNGHGYFLVFDTLAVSTQLTYPIGEEKFIAGDSLYISWDAHGNESSDFSIEFSDDDGINWTSVNTTIPATNRWEKWFTPNVTTEKARIKLIHNGTGIEQVSRPFTIVGVPAIALASIQCEGYIAINWNEVPGATDYEVMLLQGDEMIGMGTTTNLTYTLSGLANDSTYWFSVRARVNGKPGRKAVALSRVPNAGNCSGTISDHDLKIDALLSPLSGREFTSSALTTSTPIRVRIENLDNAVNTSFAIKYSVNGSPFVSENNTSNISSRGLYTHTFTTPYDFSIPGTYVVKVVVQNLAATDPVAKNDTLTSIVKNIPNAPVSLIAGDIGLLDNVESLPDSVYYSRQIGLAGGDRYDFTASTVNGRLQTFVNSGIAYSGKKAFTLDAKQYIATGVADSLTATYNLGDYITATDDLRLDFVYKNHGQDNHIANKVWIRGRDTDSWLELYDLYANQADIGQFKKTTSIELSDILANGHHSYSTSTQIRWGQWGQFITADNQSGSGYTFDDIHLYKVIDDMQLISIDTPILASCALDANVPVSISVRNSTITDVHGVPVSFQIGNGIVVTETVPLINGKSTIQYTFTTRANLSTVGSHQVKTWVNFATDSYRLNDTATITVYNAPAINSFPYLENFESGAGNWHAAGKNSSWEYGTPASPRINRAASGAKAWKTTLVGNYNDGEKSYLYSPCFDISSMTTPTLSFSLAYDIEDCGPALCDAAYMEYSVDGLNWTKLGNINEGLNWYNRNYTDHAVWSQQFKNRWQVATIPLPTTITGNLRLRFVMESDPFTSREGIAIDDVHIYDNTNGIYVNPPSTSAAITAAVAGSNWQHFTDDNKLIASVNANGQPVGNFTARAYIYTDSVRDTLTQYYLNRNITVNPVNTNLTDSVTIRYYFTDAEVDSVAFAATCIDCIKPTSAYDWAIAIYNDAADKTNGTLADNNNGTWFFIPKEKISIVPFDIGYYAEFKTNRFAEYWLVTQPITNTEAPQFALDNFTAEKVNQDVLTRWQLSRERHVDTYEVEVARNNTAFQQNDFSPLTKLRSAGNTITARQYEFTDSEPNKTGTRYYRLKITDIAGNSVYSDAIPIVFTEDLNWQVYPNPSDNTFSLSYQLAPGKKISLRLMDMHGKKILQKELLSNGFLQKEDIALAPGRYAPGIYLLEVFLPDGERKLFRLVRK